MTKLGPKSVHTVRCRGGNMKYRAMRLETGNFAWGSEVVTKKVRVLDVVYNASNNELVRTKTLVKNAIVQIDATCAPPRPRRLSRTSLLASPFAGTRAPLCPLACSSRLLSRSATPQAVPSVV
jgi:ribosomal protein eS8